MRFKGWVWKDLLDWMSRVSIENCFIEIVVYDGELITDELISVLDFTKRVDYTECCDLLIVESFL